MTRVITQDSVETFAWVFLHKRNFFRRKLISLVGWRWFERIVILVIILNCIMLALYNPMDKYCQTSRCSMLEKLEHFIFSFFLIEMLVKMTAMGIFGSKGYFTDRWNLFDFLIVVTGIVESLGTTGGFLTTVRLCRILRPLRAINRVPNIRILVNLLMDTIPMLGNVLILAFLVFACFGILGVQLFQGKLRSRCYWSGDTNVDHSLNDTLAVNRSKFPEFYIPTTSVDYVCHLPHDFGSRSCDQIPKHYDFKLCQTYYNLYDQKFENATANNSCLDARRYYRSCRQDGPNPYYGSVSFDNIALAFVFIYQVVTLEGWSDLMYLVQDSYSSYAWIYFITLISIGSFFLVNLALVVITMQFSETKRREMRLIKQNRHFGSSQLSLYTDLCSIWKRVCNVCSCFTNYFRSIHHIHQHVFVHQQSSLCDHCRREYSPDEPTLVSLPKNNLPQMIIPNIEVSQFEKDEDGLCREQSFPEVQLSAEQRSASFPGLNPKSLDLQSCASFECSIPSCNNSAMSTPRKPPPIMKPDVGILSPMTKTFNYINSFTFDEHFVEMEQNNNNLDNANNNNNTNASLLPSTPNSLRPTNNMQLLTPGDAVDHNYLKTNTFSLHADTSVTVRGSRSSSIRSRTSVSLRINGESIEASTCLDTDKRETRRKYSTESKSRSHSVSSQISSVNEAATSTDGRWRKNSHANILRASVSSSQISATDSSEYSCSDFDGSVFDLRHCDKYYVSEVPSRYKQFKLFCNHLAESSKYSELIMSIIVLNTICMAVEHYNEPERMTKILEILNLIFIWIFTIEMIVKMFGIGLRAYFQMGFNCFDCIVVMLSMMELLINDNNSSGNFTVFRSLRLLRIFRLIRPMRHQIAVMLRTTSSVMTFFALLFLFMFTFAILGMHIFGGKFVFKNRYGKMVLARSNFDSFVWAIVTVFQILTQEDWNLVMYDGIRATTKWASLYFLSLMTIGYYVLFNLLVAILVEGFTTPLEKKRMTRHIVSLLKSKANKKMLTLKRTISLPDMLMNNNNVSNNNNQNTQEDETETQGQIYARMMARRRTLGTIGLNNHDTFSSTKNNAGDYSSSEDEEDINLSPLAQCVKEKTKQNKPILLSARVTYDDDPKVLEWKALNDVEANTALLQEYNREKKKNWNCVKRLFPNFTSYRNNWSFYLFPVDCRFRRTMIRITASKWFDAIILLLILYSCVLLALENPHKKMSPSLRYLIDTSMFMMTWIFFIEMMIKVIADGFISGHGSYLRCGWNVLDFMLVLTSIVDVFITLYFSGTKAQHIEIIKGMRVLRATRALRPLRMIRKAPGLKLVVQTLLFSLKPIGNTVLIATIFFIVFGILGVQQLKGKFYYCFGVTANLVRNKTECIQHPDGVWTNYQYNFDNLLEALMTLFVVSTKDGWIDIMRRGIDARGVDLAPRTNYAQWRILYFVSFLLIGGFLVLNMIVGVVVENFQKCQELQDIQSNKARNVLQKWKKKIEQRRNNYWREYPPWRKRIYKLCTSASWDVAITSVICSNVVIMSLEHYQMSEEFHILLEVCNIIFTTTYICEAVLLMVALSPRRYVKNKWYCFDLLVVIVSIISIFFDYLNVHISNVNPAAIKAMRLLRVIRALKLLKMAKGLRFLLNHVAETIPQVTNLALLFSLLFFVYSCLGIQLFGTLECTNRFPCAGLGRHANFKTLGNSMLTLFRIATGDNWSGIMRDTLRSSCDNSIQCTSNCCVSRYVAPLFFVSFVLFAQFVLVNIVIAVLMKHLRVTTNGKKKRKDLKKLSRKRDKRSSLDEESHKKRLLKNLAKWKRNITKERSSKSSIKLKLLKDGNQTIELANKNSNKQETETLIDGKRISQFIESCENRTTLPDRCRKCSHPAGTCGRSRKKLLRKYSCPEKFQSSHTDKCKLNPPPLFNISSKENMSLFKRRLLRKNSRQSNYEDGSLDEAIVQINKYAYSSHNIPQLTISSKNEGLVMSSRTSILSNREHKSLRHTNSSRATVLSTKGKRRSLNRTASHETTSTTSKKVRENLRRTVSASSTETLREQMNSLQPQTLFIMKDKVKDAKPKTFLLSPQATEIVETKDRKPRSLTLLQLPGTVDTAANKRSRFAENNSSPFKGNLTPNMNQAKRTGNKDMVSTQQCLLSPTYNSNEKHANAKRSIPTKSEILLSPSFNKIEKQKSDNLLSPSYSERLSPPKNEKLLSPRLCKSPRNERHFVFEALPTIDKSATNVSKENDEIVLSSSCSKIEKLKSDVSLSPPSIEKDNLDSAKDTDKIKELSK
ncbi:voltage-dependent T-type calcium channel subunit alpha-1H-like isoform X1 [Clytia hemisphaerica]|uniref:Ion transport domain-containing protein n=1 Tax=Clytia hemisphaerica TaxID=252671 RepID=A0A7M5WWN1_9CNID